MILNLRSNNVKPEDFDGNFPKNFLAIGLFGYFSSDKWYDLHWELFNCFHISEEYAPGMVKSINEHGIEYDCKFWAKMPSIEIKMEN